MTYNFLVSAIVTIHPVVEISVEADNEAEAIAKANLEFTEELTDEFGWIDYDEVNIERIRRIDDED